MEIDYHMVFPRPFFLGRRFTLVFPATLFRRVTSATNTRLEGTELKGYPGKKNHRLHQAWRLLGFGGWIHKNKRGLLPRCLVFELFSGLFIA